MLGARASGKGRLVDVGTMEALAGLHQWSLVHFTHQGVIKQRGGNRHVESFHPMGLQQVKDGWVVLGVSTQAQYESMCIAMELPELITDERFLTGGHRVDHGEEFDALIAPWLRARTRAEVVEAFQAARVPSGKVLTLDETLADPQLEARALWVTPERFGLRAKMPGVPFAIGGERPLFREAPQFAADTLAVLLEAGMAPAEIDKLIAEGVAAARTEVEA
jgi:crotonobetainyl-CoA:carnitine CoA-transferase CaiB-like acyl-CoA transferase